MREGHVRFKRTNRATVLGADSRLEPPPHVLAASQGEETVLLDVERGRYYALNDVGTRIWNLVCEGVPFAGIVERVCAEYDVPRERAEADAAALIRRLSSESLVRCEP